MPEPKRNVLPTDLARGHPHQLSGGQARRVGVARAIALNPDLIIAAEPTAGHRLPWRFDGVVVPEGRQLIELQLPPVVECKNVLLRSLFR
ncbi:ATP-binding cassette domain-containing protein [Mesorhizobium sp. M0340]|uniref:ATP-binding cassette domain-containing protein n=1 Tax=Mesorhizobium sp. M0340 TaxID=2956939 RepID=UPI0033392993